jgi:radical SAM protein with 4Fe4S-binding SPASM domain
MKRSEQAPGTAERAGLCVMPWINLNVRTNGELAPCCEFGGDIGNLSNTTLDEAWRSDKLQDVRRRFASGQKVRECWKCADREAHEGTSMRLEMNAHYAAWTDRLMHSETLMEAAPSHPAALDLRFSNLCNFKCRNCSHAASSRWYIESKKLGRAVGPTAEIRSFGSVDDVIAQFGSGLDCLEEIYFAGGEPLIQEEHYALLQLLCERNLTHVRLSYNTNMSVTRFAGQSIFDLWNRFSTVLVGASVDAAGDRGAYLRSGFDWQTFVTNVNALKAQCPKVHLRFGITVSSVNIQSLPELLRQLQQACGASPEQFHLHSLQSPSYYRTQILPRAQKRAAAENIEAYLAELAATGQHSEDALEGLRHSLRGLIGYMNATDLSEQLPAFTSMTGRLDELRSENLAEAFPELSPLLEPVPPHRAYYLASKHLLRRGVNKIRRHMGLHVPR